MYIYRYV